MLLFIGTGVENRVSSFGKTKSNRLVSFTLWGNRIGRRMESQTSVYPYAVQKWGNSKQDTS